MIDVGIEGKGDLLMDAAFSTPEWRCVKRKDLRRTVSGREDVRAASRRAEKGVASRVENEHAQQPAAVESLTLTTAPMGVRCGTWLRSRGRGGSYVMRPVRCDGMATTVNLAWYLQVPQGQHQGQPRNKKGCV
jgi:hypothetical protein